MAQQQGAHQDGSQHCQADPAFGTVGAETEPDQAQGQHQRAELDGGFEVRPVGDFTVEGREETLAVYRLLPPATANQSGS